MDISTKLQTAADFRDNLLRIAGVFQHGITFDSLKEVVSERQCFDIADDAHSRQWKEVDVNVPVDSIPSTSDIKIPTT